MLDNAVSNDFQPPFFDGPLLADNYISRVPEPTTCKGLFFGDIVRLLDAAPPAAAERVKALREKRYVAFKDYPLTEHMRLTAEVTKVLFPDLPGKEAMRRLGWLAFPTFAGSLIGRVIFGVLGSDLDRIFSVGPKSFSVSMSRGHARAEKIAERHWRYDCHDFFGYLDAYYVGVIEGPIRHFGFQPDVRMRLSSLSDGVVDIQWK